MEIETWMGRDSLHSFHSCSLFLKRKTPFPAGLVGSERLDWSETRVLIGICKNL